MRKIFHLDYGLRSQLHTLAALVALLLYVVVTIFQLSSTAHYSETNADLVLMLCCFVFLRYHTLCIALLHLHMCTAQEIFANVFFDLL